MEELKFINSLNHEVYYLAFKVENEKGNLVISHGMAEHPERYEQLANYLNEAGISVYAIYHIGHGKYAKKLGHMADNEFNECISNVSELVDLVKKDSDKPVILLGHSMGSFIAQTYVTRFNNIDGLLLSGSTCYNGLFKMANMLSKLVCAFSKDTSKESKFLDNLSFGTYNSKFKKEGHKFAWLNQDVNEVIKYENDPYCGFVCSQSFFKNFSNCLASLANKNNLSKINKELPILIIGGENDPVSSYSKGLYKLFKQYQKLGLKKLEVLIYSNARHEIYLEKCKENVFKDTLSFINKVIEKEA